MWLSAILGQLPFIVIGVIAAVVAAIVVRGPARWLSVAGILAGALSSVVVAVMIAVDPGAQTPAVWVVSSALSIVGIVLLALSVIVAHRWGQQRARRSTVPPVMPG